jgi:hypothetical protein
MIDERRILFPGCETDERDTRAGRSKREELGHWE